MSDIIEQINSLDSSVKLLVAGIGILMAILISRFAIVKPWLKVVKITSVEWDDELHAPISNRLYSFILVGGIHFSLNWIYPEDGEWVTSVSPFFSVFYIILSTSLASVSIRHIVPAISERFKHKSSVTVSGSNHLIIFILRGMVWFGGIYLALSEMGIELLGLFASLAVFSIIIGLAMQQTLGNIVNSFMLSLDQPFEVGDRIEVEGMIGSVASVGILSTKILTYEETLVVIPNNTLVNSIVINHARGGGDGVARRISLVLDIGVEYGEDVDHVKYTLLQLMRECPYVIDNPNPRVLLNELGDFAKVFRMYGWVKDYSDEWVAKDWVLKAIDERFSEEGIGIPFPTALHIRKEHKSTVNARKKDASVRLARMQMIKEDKKLKEERESARKELEEIKERLKDIELDESEQTLLEETSRELERIISMFEAGED
jgi:small-conductance mechanosensitive channel